MGEEVGARHVATGKDGRDSGAQVIIHHHGAGTGEPDSQGFQAQVLDIGVAAHRQQQAIEFQLALAVGGPESDPLPVVPGAEGLRLMPG